MLSELHLGTVDEFEAKRAAELQKRAKALPHHARRFANGETRQFDGRHETTGDNPLFHRLTEDERAALLRANHGVVDLTSGSLDHDNAAAEKELDAFAGVCCVSCDGGR
jgi:hypothetical protein